MMPLARFLVFANHAGEVDLSSAPVRAFIALLKQHHVDVDLTLSREPALCAQASACRPTPPSPIAAGAGRRTLVAAAACPSTPARRALPRRLRRHPAAGARAHDAGVRAPVGTASPHGSSYRGMHLLVRGAPAEAELGQLSAMRDRSAKLVGGTDARKLAGSARRRSHAPHLRRPQDHAPRQPALRSPLPRHRDPPPAEDELGHDAGVEGDVGADDAAVVAAPVAEERRSGDHVAVEAQARRDAPGARPARRRRVRPAPRRCRRRRARRAAPRRTSGRTCRAAARRARASATCRRTADRTSSRCRRSRPGTPPGGCGSRRVVRPLHHQRVGLKDDRAVRPEAPRVLEVQLHARRLPAGGVELHAATDGDLVAIPA